MNFGSALSDCVLFFDGAMGTMLQQAGLSETELPEEWNLAHSDEVKKIHAAYLRAGCNIIKTNTFGANRLKLGECRFGVPELVTSAVKIAKAAVSASGIDQHGQGALVALDIGPTGKLLRPLGEVSFDEAYDAFAETVLAGAAAGADLVLVETMNDTLEAKAAVLAAKENCELPVVVTFTFDQNGKLLNGADVQTVAAMFEGLGIAALGFNCGLGTRQMLGILPQLTAVCGLPVAVNANAGLPVTVNGKTVFTQTPDEFAQDCAQLIKQGASLVGGCCGTTPEHLAAMITLCGGLKCDRRPECAARTAVSSYSKTVVFGGDTLIIGERLNPTGKPRLREALRDGDTDFICREALLQVDAGADILDLNVGCSGIDQKSAMLKCLEEIQAVTDVPVQLDSTDPEVLGAALRVYNGKPLINSVNAEEKSLHTVLPLVKKYGAAVVALTLDENGIPDTVQGRLETAKKILAAAQEYGIPRENIIFDTLAMSAATGRENVETTMGTLGVIGGEWKMNTVLGVSNVSFGLPEREHINATFLTMAMDRGLSAAIINPLDKTIMTAYSSYNALFGADRSCVGYIDFISGNSLTKTVNDNSGSEKLTLYSAILKGLKDRAYELALELGQTTELTGLVSEHIVPALDEVGEKYAAGTFFLPQLLMSAQAAGRAFDAARSLMPPGAGENDRKPVVIATVKGDRHDIGKNIVRVLLENYGFNVIDLGKDVAPEAVVDAAKKSGAKLVGLSALMTTTVENMRLTIELLRREYKCKIMVGGAVLTEEYAKSIGADFYAPDAMCGVRIAESIYGSEV